MATPLNKLTDAEKLTLSTRVKTDYEEAKGHFITYHKDRFDKYYKNFRDYGDDRLAELKKIGGDKWMSNLFVPITSSHIRTAQAKINARLPEWKVDTNNEKDLKKLDDVNALLGYAFKKVKLEKKVKDIVKTSFVYGTAFGKKIWAKHKYYRRAWENKKDSDGNNVIKLIKKESYRINDPVVVNCDIYNVWPDPKGNVININGQDAACGYVVQRYLLTKLQIAQQYNIDLEVLNAISGTGWSTQDYGSIKLEVYKKNANNKLKNNSNTNVTGTTAINTQAICEVVEHWTDDEYTVMLGDTILIHMDNPYGFEKPYERLCYEELPGQMFGVGIAEQVEQSQAGVNTITNITIDNTTLNVHSMFKAPEGKNYNAKDFVVRPYGVIRGDVTALVKPPMDPAAYRERDTQTSYADMADGLSDASRGTTLDASTAATSVNAQQSATEDRLGLFIENLNEFYGGVMKSFVDYMYWFYPIRTVELASNDGVDDLDRDAAQLFDFKVPIENSGENKLYKAMERESLNGDFIFNNTNNSMIRSNKEFKRKQTLELSDRIQTMSQNEYFAPAIRRLDPDKIVKDIFAAYDYNTDDMGVSEEQKGAQDAERDELLAKENNAGGPGGAPTAPGGPIAGTNQFGPIPAEIGMNNTVDSRGAGQEMGSQLSNLLQ